MNIKCVSTTVKMFHNGKLFNHDIKYLISIGNVYTVFSIYDKCFYIMPDHSHSHCRLPIYLFEIVKESTTDLEESRTKGDKVMQNALQNRRKQILRITTIWQQIAILWSKA